MPDLLKAKQNEEKLFTYQNYWKKCEKSTLKIRCLIDINWSSLKTLHGNLLGNFRNTTPIFFIIHLKIIFSKKKYDEQIFTSVSFKISPILPKTFVTKNRIILKKFGPN